MSKDQIQALYAALAQKLGDLEYKKSQLEDQIKSTRQEMYAIGFVNTISKQLEDEENKKQALILEQMRKKQQEERAKSELQAKSPPTAK